MRVDPNSLMNFCHAIEEASGVGSAFLREEELIATIEELQILKEDVEQALLRLTSLTPAPIH